jgi:predicted RNase H-like nuclease (RuvC/YqgF family)
MRASSPSSFPEVPMPSLHRLLPALAAASLVAVAAPHAAAQSKTLGTGKPVGLIMTRNELRACMAQQESLKTKRAEMTQLQAQLEKEKEEIRKSGDELKDKLVWLDRTSKEQVDAYNAEATERDKRIDAYQARTTDYNTKVDALQADRDAWGRNCENRRYDEKDEMAIKMGK